MPAYILRDIDPTLWMRAKVRALQDGMPLRGVMLKLYAEGDIVNARESKKSKPRRRHTASR